MEVIIKMTNKNSDEVTLKWTILDSILHLFKKGIFEFKDGVLKESAPE